MLPVRNGPVMLRINNGKKVVFKKGELKMKRSQIISLKHFEAVALAVFLTVNPLVESAMTGSIVYASETEDVSTAEPAAAEPAAQEVPAAAEPAAQEVPATAEPAAQEVPAAVEAPSAVPAAADSGSEQAVQAAASAQTVSAPVETPQVNEGGENVAANTETTAEDPAAAEQTEAEVPAAEQTGTEARDSEQADAQAAGEQLPSEESRAAEETETEPAAESQDEGMARAESPKETAEKETEKTESAADTASTDTTEKSTVAESAGEEVKEINPEEAAPAGVAVMAAAVPLRSVRNTMRDASGDSNDTSSDSGTTAEPAGTAGLLQQLIREKLAGVSSSSRELVITLLKQNVYEGDVTIEQTGVPGSSDFVLKLVAEDAAAENGAEYNGEGSGSAMIGGNLNIKGINVLLQGVAMAVGKKVTVENAELTYKGGKENDTLDVELGDMAKADIRTYAGKDKVSVTIAGGQEVTVDTGDDDDIVAADLQYGFSDAAIDTGRGDDHISLKKTDTANASNPAAAVTVRMGEGVDRLDIDLGVAGSAGIVKTDAGEGEDRIHFTGRLKNDAGRSYGTVSEDEARKQFDMWDDHSGNNLRIYYDNTENFTDALENKKSVALKDVVDGKFESFTNYTLTKGTEYTTYDLLDEDLHISMNVKAIDLFDMLKNLNLKMSSLVVDGTRDANLYFVNLKEKIDVRGMNLLVTGKRINIDNTIKADNIIVNARSVTNVTLHQLQEEETEARKLIFDIAEVTLNKGARMQASRDMDLTAYDEQTRELIPFLSVSDMEKNDIANVRIGKADVTVKNGAEISAGGSVNLIAQTVTKADTVSSGTPVTVAAVFHDAEVNVEEGAVITAASNMSFNSESRVKVNVLAGAASNVLPMAAAVNVLSSDARTTVNGILEAGGSIRVRAEGTTDAAAGASRGNQPKDRLSGGYIGVDIALQNVQAVIGPKAIVRSAGGVTVESVADEKVNTQVTAGESASKANNANAGTTMSDSRELLRKTASKLREFLTKEIDEHPSGEGPLFKALEKLVEIPVPPGVDPDSEEHGEVKVVRNSKKDAVTGNEVQVVQVTVTPGEGYRVSRVWYSYIDNKDGAAADYTVGEAVLKDGTWQFVEPAFAAVIHVDYEDGQNNEGPDAGAGNDGDGFEGMFDENDRQPDISLDDAMNAAAGAESVNGNEKASENQGSSEDASGSQEQTVCREFRILPTESRNENGAAAGAVLTGTFDSTTGKCITKAAAGDKIVFVINPADGYTLSEDGLVVRYRTAADGSEIEKIISADADGNYAFTVSDGILENAYTDAGGNAYAFQVVSRFEKIGQEDQKNDPGKNKDAVSQSAAALAVTVAGNRNKASIADGAQVSSEDVTISAKENTVVKNDADGNPADPESVPSADQDDRMRSIVNAVSTEDYLDVIYSTTTAKEGDIITVTAKVKNERADAFGLEEVLELRWNDSSGQEHTKVVKYNEDGEASFVMPDVKKGESLKVAIHYGPKDVPVSLATPESQKISLAVSRADVGESISLKLSDEDEQSGKKIKSAVITYTDRDKHGVTKTVEAENGKLVIPEDALKHTDAGGSYASVTVKSVEIVDKDVAIDWSCTTPDEGTLRITTARMDLDETIPVVVQPKDGYTLKEGTAEFTIGGKNYEVSIRKDDDGKYYVKLPQEVTLSSFGTGPKHISVNLKGTFEKATENKDPDSKNSIGAGVAVNVVNTDNTAEISGGTISAGSVTVRADAVSHVGTTAKAGFSDGGDPGIGGAVAVQVSGLDNAALVKKGTDGSITTNSLVVNADGTYRTELTADAAGKGEGPDAGTGPGIGVSVNSAQTKAGIQDGVKLTAKDDLSEVTVKAVTNAGDKLTARAGAAAGTAAVPVMAADVADAGAKAYAGRITGADGSALKAGKVTVDAVNNAFHTVTADASAAEKGVAMGGAFDIAVVKDSALAELRSSVSGADSVSVSAKSADQVTSMAAAGASGGAKGKAKSDGSEGSTDKQVDKILGGAGNLAAKNGNADTMKAAKGRQKAQTSEGIVAGAAAAAVNVAGNSAIARVADGADMNNVKAISITSENRTRADVKADASTTSSGTGAGAAINEVNIENKARMGNGKVTGVGSLNIAALMPESVKTKADAIAGLTPEDTGKHVINTEAISGAGAGNTGVAGSVAITVLNSNTEAVIANGDNNSGVDVAGGLVMDARESRRVANVASAAVDENNRADTNEGAAGNKKSVGAGASFSMVCGSSSVGTRSGSRDLKAGSLYMNAGSDHLEKVVAVAGRDALAGVRTEDKNDLTGDFALDAAAALNMLDNSVKTQLGSAETTGRGGKAEQVSSRAPEMNKGEIRVIAHENAFSDTRASSFAMDNAAAVGATAAVNIARSEVETSVTGNTRAAANVIIDANSHSEDETAAYATEMGADLERIRNRNTDNSKNKTAANINKRLNDMNNKKPAEDQGDAADNSLSLSANAARTLNVSIPDTSEADAAQQEAEDAASDGLEKTLTGSDNGKSGKDKDNNKIQNAAAIGVTVSGHSVKSTANGDVTAGDDIRITAENSGNFSTLGSGAAISLVNKENSVATGVAVSVNENTAEAEVGGNLKANEYGAGGDISLTSELTQNMDGNFRDRLAAQAISGAVSGADPAASAAVAVAAGTAKSTVNVKGGTDDGSRQKLDARKVVISAVDKTKLAARAGGASYSGGAADMGLSAADLRSRNTVSANVGDYTEIEAMRLDVTAEKKAVSMRDFTVQPLAKALSADPSDLSDAERESTDTGIISVKKGNDDKNYTLDVNLSSEELAGSPDLPGFLASAGYYAEAASGAGSAAVTDIANTVSSTLGDHVKVNLIGQDAAGTGLNGDMNVTAASESSARLIAGTLSAAPVKGSAGMMIALVTDRDDVKAATGSHADITTAGSFRQNAKADGDIQLFTEAAAVESGSGSSPASGGARNVISRKSTAASTLKDDASIRSAGEMEVSSDIDGDLLVLSLDAAGNKGKTAAGGTVNVVSDKAQSLVNIGERSSLYAENDMTIQSGLADHLISGSASGSAGKGGVNAAGVVSALIAGSRSNVDIAQGMKLRSGSGSVKVLADSDTGMVNAILPAAGGEKAAVGAAAGLNIYNREAKVNLAGKKTLSADNDIEAGQNVVIRSNAKDLTVTAGLAPAGSEDSSAAAGNMQLLIGNSEVGTTISDGLRIKADNDAIIESSYDDLEVEAAGSVANAKSTAGAGPVLAVLKKGNKVETNVGTSHISGYRRTKGSPAPGTDIAGGVYVGATAKETIFLGNAGAAEAPEAAGTVVQVINNNTVVSDASGAVLNADNGGKASGEAADAGVCVQAKDDTAQTILAGGVNVSGTRGTGASVVTQISGKTVKARGSNIRAEKDVNILADNTDTSTLVSVSADPAKNAAVNAGAVIQIMGSTVHATLDGEVISHNGSFNLRANNNTDLRNAEAAVGADGKAGVTPTAAVTCFEGDVMARVLSGSRVTLYAGKGQRADVAADSTRDIGIYSVGSAGDGQAGVSGSVNLMLSGKDKDKVQAIVEPTAFFDLNNSDLNVQANNNYKLNAASAAAAGAGKAAAAVNAVVSILKTRTEALMQGNALTKAAVSVKANADLDVVNTAASGGLAGTGSAGATVMALVTGDKMTQDTADMLSYGNSKSEKEKQTTFDMSKFLKTAQHLGARTDGLNTGRVKDEDAQVEHEDSLASLIQELAGNGYHDSRQCVGSKKDDGEFGFDAVSGMKESLRGQTGELEESRDIEAARNIGSGYDISDESGDHVKALIADTSAIAAHDISVAATQDTRADLISGALTPDGVTGTGVGASAVVLRSNVKAGSEGNLTVDGGSLTVKAESGSSKVNSGANNNDTPSIRSIGLAAGESGTAGTGVAVSVVRLDNDTEASLGGKVNSVQNVNVQADSTYDNVLAAVQGADEGTVGAGASVAAVQSRGGLTAKIASGADIAAATDSTLSVNSNSVFNVNAMAAALSDGRAGANAGLAIVKNEQDQNTYIERGVTIKQSGDSVVAVRGTSLNSANARILGLSADGAAIGLGGAVSIIKPTVHTSIGVEGSGVVTLEAPKANVIVQNDVTGSAATDVRTLTADGPMMNGNALLVFNETDAEAKVANLTATQGIADMTIRSDVSADAKSEVTGDGIGGLNAGISVNYSDVSSRNSALLDTSDLDAIFGSLTVKTGDGSQLTHAQANTVTGALGALNEGQNTAIAWNRAKNTAGISGTKKLTVKDKLTLSGSGTADAAAEMTGMDIGALPAAASVVAAVNQAENNVTLDLAEFDVGQLDMGSDLTADTLAKVRTGGGSLISDQASLAAAYGDTKSTLKVTNNGEESSFIRGDMDMYNTVKDTVKTEVTNSDFSFIGASGIIGLAYARDDVSTILEKQDQAPGGKENRLQIDGHGIMKTCYSADADADVTPSAGGRPADPAASEAGAGTLGKAVTRVDLAGQGASDNVIQAADGFAIRTLGSIHAGAAVNTPDKAINVAALAADRATAVNAAQLFAGMNITGAGRLESGQDVRILSDAERSEAVAAVGGGTSGEKKVSFDEEVVNSAIARESLKNTAELVLEDPAGKGEEENGAESGIIARHNVELRAAMMDNDESATRSRAEARTLGAKSDSLPTAGSMEAGSYLQEEFLAKISGDDILVRACSGNITVRTLTDGDSAAGSVAPGSLSGTGASGSRAEAHVGTGEADQERQSSQVILTGSRITLDAAGGSTGAGPAGRAAGEQGAVPNLKGGAVRLEAINRSSASAKMESSPYNLANADSAAVPTESYLLTQVILGDGTNLLSGDGITINSVDRTKACSIADADTAGLKSGSDPAGGENTVNTRNVIDLGTYSELRDTGNADTAKGPGGVFITAASGTDMNAQTLNENGKAGGSGGSSLAAANNLDRSVTVDLGSARIEAANGSVGIAAISGEDDCMNAEARFGSSGLPGVTRSEATNNRTVQAAVIFDGAENFRSAADMDIRAKLGSPTVRSHAGTVTGSATGGAEAYASNNHNETAAVSVNGGGGTAQGNRKIELESTGNDVRIRALADDVSSHTTAYADGAGTAADAYANIDYRVKANVDISNAELTAAKGAVHLLTKGTNAGITLESEARAKGAGAGANAHMNFLHDLSSSITSQSPDTVKFNASTVIHKAYKLLEIRGDGTNPAEVIMKGHADASGISTTNKKYLSYRAARDGEKEFCQYVYCVFCGEEHTPDEHKDDPLKPDKDTDLPEQNRQEGLTGASAPGRTLRASLSSGVTDDSRSASEALFVLDLAVILRKDVRLGQDELAKYLLWNNTETQRDEYLLPNAAHLSVGAGRKLCFVTDVLEGEILNDGRVHKVNMISALNEAAVNDPTIGIGRNSSLNFTTGTLKLGSDTSLDLYLEEVSGSWLKEQFGNGTMKALAEQSGDIAAAAAGEQPEGLKEGTGRDGRKLYWFGRTPEDAADGDAPLYFMTLDEDTDEVRIFRTSAAAFEAGEEATAVSLFVFRNKEADRMGEVQYDVMFRDLSEEEDRAMLNAHTLVPGPDVQLEIPAALAIVLRDFSPFFEGADWPVYKVSDELFFMNDVTDGTGLLFAPDYTVYFDGATFDSTLTKIEGIDTGDCIVTVKSDQPVWAEWDTQNTAHDIGGRSYVLNDDGWEEET